MNAAFLCTLAAVSRGRGAVYELKQYTKTRCRKNVNSYCCPWRSLQVAGCCWADYTFFQTYHSYLNPEHSRGDTGQCCDSQDMPPCPEFSSCDNIFTLCVQSTGQPLPPAGIIQPQDCPLGYGVTDIFPNSDNITFDASMPVASTGDIWLVG